MNKTVYVDNAATTALSKTAFEAMLPYLTTEYGNPSSAYSFGHNAKRAIQKSREKVASSIGALPEEIYFTGGGTEADNWAIKSAAKLKQNAGKHIISSAIEHHAVLHTLDSLKEQGYEITCMGVDKYGQISLQELCSAIRKDTVLISIMAANNEIGTILPTAQIGAIASEHGIAFHTDAVQAVGHIPINVRAMNVDMLSLSFGHPLSILTSLVAAPFTTLNPLIACGWVTGLVEATIRKPVVQDINNISKDIFTIKGFFKNRFLKVLLIVIMANIGSSIGSFIAGLDIVKTLFRL